MNDLQRREYRRRLRTWFRQTKRDLPWRDTRDPYRVWVSEVMLQQTQVATVVPYFQRFVARYPDILTLAGADQQDILKSWEKMGYYARARNLHKAAGIVAREYDGHVPSDYDTFRALPGVGDYIAAAVMSIAFERPFAVVDGNVKRVLSRLLMIEEPVNKPSSKKRFQSDADDLLDTKHPGDFNQAMMELGATVCRPKQPLCEDCPVLRYCAAYLAGCQSDFPVRAPRKKVPHYHIAGPGSHRICADSGPLPADRALCSL